LLPYGRLPLHVDRLKASEKLIRLHATFRLAHLAAADSIPGCCEP
jgi:hypothetical protein